LARNGQTIPATLAGDVRKIGKNDVDNKWLSQHAGQVLCGKNKTRADLNARIRTYLGYEGPIPKNGETLVCLRNKHDIGLLNGVICNAHGDAVPVDDETIGLNVRYEGSVLYDLLVDNGPFGGDSEARMFMRQDICQFDFGYAITVHKAQGSQWHHVTIWDDGFGKWDAPLRKQWLYTAITRASHKLTILGSSR
jgi:exodeoxyribonuclease-5